MLFSSISFLYYFLPVVLVLYFVVPKQLKNFILLLSSLFFYFYGEPIYCGLMVFSALSGFLHGIWIAKARGGRCPWVPLVSSILFVIAPLLLFKYTDFFIANLNSLGYSQVALFQIVLPIGISFYSFQILSYTIDVYRGKAKVQRSIIDFTTYVSLFPQLIAGPIVRYTTVEAALSQRTHSFAGFAWGVRRFVIGLSKKVLIANTLGELVTIFSRLEQKTILFYWLAALAFMLQIYFDFSGYSDMAIGLGRIFGFQFLENFNYPYISRSITEFWRRWHISLGTWFRDYVYIPMGGNRVPVVKWIGNISITWFLIGFWHGAEWNFVLWGLIFALLLIGERLFFKRLLDRLPTWVGHLYVLFVVITSLVLFNADGIRPGLENLRGMFGLLGAPLTSAETNYYCRSYFLVLIIGIVGSTPLLATTIERFRSNDKGAIIIDLLEPAVLFALLLLVTGYLVDGSFNPFLYFRF